MSKAFNEAKAKALRQLAEMTEAEDQAITVAAESDPDAPELTEDWFAQADQYDGGKLVRRGRPPKETPKPSVTIRLDAEVLERFRASGPGWQSRINDILRRAVGL